MCKEVLRFNKNVCSFNLQFVLGFDVFQGVIIFVKDK